ncbi:WGR domain-containing protein [Nonomuraea sp. NPDC051191]|uniref:WGR domain-containing protein n=1 Tax=Nonomuraea sp. NPDC051191 TaxID=3364372 RepID=UPI00379773C7
MSVERTLAFVGGGSAKFWEVRQDGVELHIRYGRMGAAGQTQVKSFGSAAAATAAADKLVAEKLRKGYTEDETAPLPQEASPAAAGGVEDEDRLTLPPTWLRALHPRRGGAKVSVKRPDASAPEKLAAELDKCGKMLADMVATCPDPALASAGAAAASLPAGRSAGTLV